MLKRGLSSVITTILIILLILAGISGIWFAVNNLILKGSESVSLSNFGIDMVVKSVKINYTNKIADVKVARNPGLSSEQVIGLKFIVEDDRSADIFEIKFPENPFKELQQRTFNLNLSQSKILNILEVWRISVAPLYISDISGKELLGPITNEYGVMNVPGDNGTEGGSGNCGDGTCDINETTVSCPADCGGTVGECTQNTDCGIDYWITGSKICNGDGTIVMQYKKIYECLVQFCQESEVLIPIETCADGSFCYAGACITNPITCTQENVTQDCGASGYLGFQYCDLTPPPEQIMEDYRNISCVVGSCVETITPGVIQICPGQQICALSRGNPECFDPLECVTNQDCALGEICVLGSCVVENVLITGTVASIWPFTLGEYFDSLDLPKIQDTTNYIGYNIIFPGSTENRCLKITEFVYPSSTQDNSYVRLNQAETNISSGDYFEVWETSYACTLI